MNSVSKSISRIRSRGAVVALLMTLAFATTVHGCACCAEPGTWFHGSVRTDAEALAIVRDLGSRLSTASLYVDAAGLEDVRGITGASETYTLKRNGPQARNWNVEFVDEKGNRGTLTLVIPNSHVSYGADPGDGQMGGGGGPLLYKEWRFQGSSSGTGIFKRGAGAGTRFRLILQGRGNMCPAAEDFKTWILQVKGPRADFSFYGQFKHPANASNRSPVEDRGDNFTHHASPLSDATAKTRAVIEGSIRRLGYEITDRRRGSDSDVISLEDRDSSSYQPLTRTLFRLRSLKPWPRDPATYYSYWLFRETFPTETQAERRVKEYLTNYTDRLATPQLSRHMISKTILRAGAKRRGATVYLLVTDAAYTFFDDKNSQRILDALIRTAP